MKTVLTLMLQACSISLLAFSSALYLLGNWTLKNFKAPSKSACRRSSLEVCNETQGTTVNTENTQSCSFTGFVIYWMHSKPPIFTLAQKHISSLISTSSNTMEAQVYVRNPRQSSTTRGLNTFMSFIPLYLQGKKDSGSACQDVTQWAENQKSSKQQKPRRIYNIF